MNLVPTASTTAALALGDALAMTLLVKKGFREEDFAALHPGGGLGKRDAIGRRSVDRRASGVEAEELDSESVVGILGVDVVAAGRIGTDGAQPVPLVRDQEFGVRGGRVGVADRLGEPPIDDLVILSAVERVVFVTVMVPREWEGPNNGVIQWATAYSNAVVVDWYAFGVGHPHSSREAAFHPQPPGPASYAGLLALQASPPS